MADYNGWTNWATWHVALLGDNDESLNNELVEYATKQARAKRNGRYDQSTAVRGFRNILREAFRETVELGSSWDNLPSFDVNWDEIASSLIDDAERELQHQEGQEEE